MSVEVNRAPERGVWWLQLVSWLFWTAAPLVVITGQLVYLRAVSRWIQATPSQPSTWALGLALPPILVELAFTWVFEARSRGWRLPVVAGLLARLSFLTFLGLLFVQIPLWSKGTNDNLPFQFWMWPVPVRIAWLGSPPLAAILGVGCTGSYLWWTVRSRKARLTTTVLLPAVATLVLAMVLYYFPDAPLRGLRGDRPEFVTSVFGPESPTQRFPRDVHVTKDERFAVASFGTSFPFFHWTSPFDFSTPLGNELGLDTLRCDEGACRKNLVVVDLRTGERVSFSVPPVRRFHADTDWPVFVVPWHVPNMLEVRQDGSIHKYSLPKSFNGWPLEEPMYVYGAPDLGRVFVLYAVNPALLSWNTKKHVVDRIVSLAGRNGILLGEQNIQVSRNPARHCLYVLVAGLRHQMLEIDERDLTVRRTLELPSFGFDIAVSPDGKTLFVPSFFTREIWRIDAESFTVRDTLSAPLHVRRVAFSPDGSRLFAVSFATGELWVYDTETGAVRDRLYIAPRLEGLDVKGRHVYVLSADGLFKIPLDRL